MEPSDDPEPQDHLRRFKAYTGLLAQLERERDEEKATDPIERAAQPTDAERKKLAALVMAEAEAEATLQSAQAEAQRTGRRCMS